MAGIQYSRKRSFLSIVYDIFIEKSNNI